MYFTWRNSIGKSEGKKRKNTRMNYSLVVGEVRPLTDEKFIFVQLDWCIVRWERSTDTIAIHNQQGIR